MDREQLLSWLGEHDHFAISMGEDDDSSLSRLRRMKEIVEQIEGELLCAAAKVRRAGGRWGVGDTSTDEKIADRFYELIHCPE